ncbi:hypothetical protein Tco_0632423 [Tanacetum coccineum]
MCAKGPLKMVYKAWNERDLDLMDAFLKDENTEFLDIGFLTQLEMIWTTTEFKLTLSIVTGQKGKCKSDMLVNNMCEVFNGKMLGGRDNEIISTLEFARECLMKRIVNVNKMIARCDVKGPNSHHCYKAFEKEQL